MMSELTQLRSSRASGVFSDTTTSDVRIVDDLSGAKAGIERGEDTVFPWAIVSSRRRDQTTLLWKEGN